MVRQLFSRHRLNHSFSSAENLAMDHSSVDGSTETKMASGVGGRYGMPSPPRSRRLSDSSDRGLPAFYIGELAEYLDDKETMEKKVVVGICAMAKKSNSKPMKEIVRRLENFTRIQIMIFDEDVILNHSVEDWPIVNAFISFFSSGFPLDKAIAYKNLRDPFVVNDLEMQLKLQDRVEVYRILEQHNIPHPRYAVLNREQDPDCKVVETEDSIEINGQLHQKPFVEKPINAEDHNVYIYFPQAAGGGSTRLFRKVKDRSSMYSHTSRVRRNGAFLYEDFMPTDGTDVKVYTVGTDYQHAEARKSPCLDGKVERDQDGKEVRYPVLLSASEKLIARKVCLAFGQNVCGFDLLRANGKCYVCDVNGFSFVKTSSKYYDDCARILGTMVLRAVCPSLHIPYPVGPAPEDIPVVPTTSGLMMELRSVVALIRHGDRTPKQKMKMEVKHKLFFELFEKHGGFRTGHLKLKRPKQLQEVLDIVRQLLASSAVKCDPDLQDKKAKLQQMKLVLEMYEFTGIHRKVQLKYQPLGRPHTSSSEDELWSMIGSAEGSDVSPCSAPVQDCPLLDDAPRDPSLLLILKWGGELTPAGRIQAENLGKAFRTLYPGGQGQFEAPGLGFLRLHSTFRHDLKIYASDEGRVQMTAAAFTKGLLALEGELTPILVQMVKSANTNGLLDGEGKTSKSQIVVKEKLKEVFNQDKDFDEEDNYTLNPTNAISLSNAMEFVKNPQAMCQHIHQMIKEITAKIRSLKVELKSRELPLYNGESWELLIRRWAKLEKDLMLKSGHFEISKIPDIYDCIKYDLQHNHKTLQYDRSNELFMCSKALADIVIPQEYGITVEEKLHIAQNYCSAFLRKIRSDFLQCINNPNIDEDTTRLDSSRVCDATLLAELGELRYHSCDPAEAGVYSKGVASPERFVRTRLYFTSESHIHSMLSMLRYGNLFEEGTDSQWERALGFLDATAELNYMSQIVFMLFEDPSKALDSDDRYHMELHFSPGAYTSCDEPTEPRGMGYRPKHPQPHHIRSDDSVDSLKGSARLVSAFTGPLPGTKKRHLRLDTGGTDLDDINESDMFEIASSSSQPTSPDCQSKLSSPMSPATTPRGKAPGKLPGSPDPNIPDWDWGEDSMGAVKVSSGVDAAVDNKKVEYHASTDQGKEKSVQVSVSVESQMPIKVTEPTSSASSNARQQRSSSPINITMSSTTATNADMSKLSLEEKRSRSFEDKNEGAPTSTTVHRNYKTVHLPLHTDIHCRRSLPCVFSLGLTLSGLRDDDSNVDEWLGEYVTDMGTPVVNHCTCQNLDSPDHDMGWDTTSAMFRRGSLSDSDIFAHCVGCTGEFFDSALEGFSYVPQLHPLETLHNNLTSRQIDDFLGRVTTTRFPMPAISPSFAETRPALMLSSPSKYSHSLSYPPSSNSSSGPSSPSSAPPIDYLSNFRAYIERQQKEEGARLEDSDGLSQLSRRSVSYQEKCLPTPPPSPGSSLPCIQDGSSVVGQSKDDVSKNCSTLSSSVNSECSTKLHRKRSNSADFVFVGRRESISSIDGEPSIDDSSVYRTLVANANTSDRPGSNSGPDVEQFPSCEGGVVIDSQTSQKEQEKTEKMNDALTLPNEQGRTGCNVSVCQTEQASSQKPASQKPKKMFTVSRIDNDSVFQAPTPTSSVASPANPKEEEAKSGPSSADTNIS